jgi:hypothetical protein
VDELIEVDHLRVLIAILMAFAAAGIIWVHFGR